MSCHLKKEKGSKRHDEQVIQHFLLLEGKYGRGIRIERDEKIKCEKKGNERK
jgi:hypothetical protein